MARRFAGAGLSRRIGARRAGFGGGGGGPPAFVGALDGIAAAGYYSCARRVYAAYTGPLFQITRASDLTTLDIFPLADGWADTAAVSAFCAGTDGRVSIVYDQSGAGRDLSQTDPAKRPTVYTAGALVLMGARLSMLFDVASNSLNRTDGLGLVGAPALTIACAARALVYQSTGRNPYGLGEASAATPFASLSFGYDSATAMTARCISGGVTFGAGITSGIALLSHYTVRRLAAATQQGNTTLRVSGVDAVETAETNPANNLALINDRTAMGNAVGLGSSAAFQGRISDLGFIPAALAGAQLTQLETHLAAVIA